METTLQKNIKLRLEKKKISVAELERRIGVRHAVINIMHGRSKNPSVHIAKAIAKALGCTIEELLSEFDNTTQTKKQEDDNSANTSHHLWNAALAKQALEALDKYLTGHNLNPPSAEIFQCIDEIYKYSYNGPQQQIDLTFVCWIAEKFFTRNFK